MSKAEEVKRVAVEKVVVAIGRREIILTTDEAKQLKDALNELFGKAITAEEHHHHHHYPWYYSYPKVEWSTANGNGIKWQDNQIYCSVGSSAVGYLEDKTAK